MSGEQREQAARGVVAVRGMLAEWQALRAELRAIEEAEHPAFTDRFGRLWTWKSKELWHHDDTLAMSRDMVDALTGLPPERLRGNPNYWQLCDICRSRWRDTSPVSPRILLSGSGYYDVRDGKYYAEREGSHAPEDAADLARWEADGGAS
jgi:hypothetical protein